MILLQPDKCFKSLDHLPLLDPFFQQEGLSAVYYLPPADDVKEKILLRAFFHDNNKFIFDPIERRLPNRIIFGQSSFAETNFCQDLQKEFGELSTKFFYFNPWSLYDWHADIDRKCSINFSLDDYPGSHTLFRQKVDSLNGSVVELHYKPRRPVILNTEIEHSVINLSDNPRYVLSVTIHDKNITFNQMVDFLSGYQMSSDQYRF